MMSSCISILYYHEPSYAGLYQPTIINQYHTYAVLLEICCIIIYLWVLCLMWVMCTFRHNKVLGSKDISLPVQGEPACCVNGRSVSSSAS